MGHFSLGLLLDRKLLWVCVCWGGESKGSVSGVYMRPPPSTDTPAPLYRHVSVSICIWTHSLIQECCLSICSREGQRASGWPVFRDAFYTIWHWQGVFLVLILPGSRTRGKIWSLWPGQRVLTPTICGFLSAEHTFPLPVIFFIQSWKLQLNNQPSQWRETSYWESSRLYLQEHKGWWLWYSPHKLLPLQLQLQQWSSLRKYGLITLIQYLDCSYTLDIWSNRSTVRLSNILILRMSDIQTFRHSDCQNFW